VTEPDDTYSAAVVEEALLAAATVAERVYEMTPGISTETEGAFRHLADAVFRWTEGLDLQQELADEGARAGAVADLADPTYAASYAVTVHQVLTAARAVQEATAREPDSLPASAVPLLDRLGSAVGEWQRQPDAAARWWEEGGRPALLHPVGAPPQPPIPPPQLRRVPRGARALRPGISSTRRPRGPATTRGARRVRTDPWPAVLAPTTPLSGSPTGPKACVPRSRSPTTGGADATS
jgi:hypothetical protein